jgi:hypothetical protein
MQNKLLKISCSVVVVISIFIASCSKEGPVGPAGATGPAGVAGPTGPTGATGIANVKYSNWINVTFQANSDNTLWGADIAAPELVDSILNKGEIKVYWNIGSDSTHGEFVVNLPILDVLLFNVPVTINPYFSFQNILLLANEDVSSYQERGYNNFQFRYILIPGGVKTGGRYATVDWKDYKAVQAYLGLKD